MDKTWWSALSSPQIHQDFLCPMYTCFALYIYLFFSHPCPSNILSPPLATIQPVLCRWLFLIKIPFQQRLNTRTAAIIVVVFKINNTNNIEKGLERLYCLPKPLCLEVTSPVTSLSLHTLPPAAAQTAQSRFSHQTGEIASIPIICNGFTKESQA